MNVHAESRDGRCERTTGREIRSWCVFPGVTAQCVSRPLSPDGVVRGAVVTEWSLVEPSVCRYFRDLVSLDPSAFKSPSRSATLGVLMRVSCLLISSRLNTAAGAGGQCPPYGSAIVRVRRIFGYGAAIVGRALPAGSSPSMQCERG